MVYLLSGIVDKFFLRSPLGSVKKHPNLALLGADHHRLATHPAHHVKGIHRAPPQRQLQGVFLDPLGDRLSEIASDLEEPVGGTKPSDPLVRPLVVVILDPQRGALHRLLEAVKLRPL